MCLTSNTWVHIFGNVEATVLCYDAVTKSNINSGYNCFLLYLLHCPAAESAQHYKNVK